VYHERRPGPRPRPARARRTAGAGPAVLGCPCGLERPFHLSPRESAAICARGGPEEKNLPPACPVWFYARLAFVSIAGRAVCVAPCFPYPTQTPLNRSFMRFRTYEIPILVLRRSLPSPPTLLPSDCAILAPSQIRWHPRQRYE
jgi:hypothetical protein